MNDKESIFKTIITVLITAAVVFVLTSSYYINNVVAGKTIDDKASSSGNVFSFSKTYKYDGSFDKLKAVLALVKKDFLFTDYDEEKLEDGAIKGLLSALDDPYTSYFNKTETDNFLTETEGVYDGVGMYVTYGQEISWPMVLSTIKGTPAEEAGIKAGDYIYEISGDEITNNTSLEEVAKRLRGKEGTEVRISVVRFNEKKEQQKLSFDLVRRRIEINDFEYEIKEGNIGYIRFNAFDQNADTKFSDAYQELVNEKEVKGLIIDIRDNPGGYLDKVTKIADMLLPSGVITYTVDKNGNKKIQYSDENQSSVPIVVIINENSASASEILAIAIKDSGVGKVVGKTTYGKGLVQEFASLGDGTYAKITIAEYFSPNGTKINENGVAPDFEVEDDLSTEIDEQLQKAIEVLKNY